MTADIIPLRDEEPLLRVCTCGCRSFTLMSDGTAECAACGTMLDDAAHWVAMTTLVGKPPEPPAGLDVFHRQNITEMTPHFVLQRGLSDHDKIVAVVLIYDGGHRTVAWTKAPFGDASDRIRQALGESIGMVMKDEQ